MEESVGKVVTLIGSSKESFEKAIANAVAAAAKTLHEIHVADVRKLYVHVENGKIISYRARVRVAFEYNPKYKK